MMAATDCYCMDTSAFVDWWVRYYPPSSFEIVPHVEQLISDGRLRSSREVCEELEVKNDDCFKWAKGQPDLFIDSDEAVQSVVSSLMGQYFNPSKPDKGIGGADPFVIGLAAIQKPKPWIIVTGEKPGSIENPKIPFVCKSFPGGPIKTITFLELIVAEGWKLK